MLDVKNYNVTTESDVEVTELWAGETFLGMLENVDGEEVEGLFLVLGDTVVCLESVESEFPSRADMEGVRIVNYKDCKAVVTVSNIS